MKKCTQYEKMYSSKSEQVHVSGKKLLFD